jgi:hypothetical protein
MRATDEKFPSPLEDWLHRDNFHSTNGRRQFRRNHPEVDGYSWQVIRQFGPPYHVKAQRRENGIRLTQWKSEKCKDVLEQIRHA